MKLADTKAIVTGGASGLGLAVAELVVARGGRVALFDINETAGAEAVKRLGSAGSFHRVDVTSEADVKEAVRLAADQLGGLNAAVNCAGIGPPRRFVGKEGPMTADQGIAARPCFSLLQTDEPRIARPHDKSGA